MFETKPKDNSKLFLKLLLRKSFMGLGLVEKGVAVDLFSGAGTIADRLYRDFRELHLVENDAKKLARLESRFSQCPNAHIWKMDNLDFIKNNLAALPGPSLIDFDAYGSPNKQIHAFFESRALKDPLLIFATDGFFISRLRGRTFSPELYLAGRDRENATGYDPVLTRNFELLIRGFWDELSKRHNFRISLFKILWKKGGQVAYYGTAIEPK
jgi:hypothetical protein